MVNGQDSPRPRILVLEDEADWREAIADVLNAMQTEARFATSVAEARAIMAGAAQDVLIVDRMLGAHAPDGLALLDGLPAPPWRPAVLVLSQVASAEERVHGLDAGADDYLAKPFAPSELRARVAALLRRRQPASSETMLAFRELRLDLPARTLRFGGQEHVLGEQPFLLLAALMRGEGEPVSHETLWREGWPQYGRLPPQERVIQVAIHRLRQRLEELTGQRWVQGARGRGYRLGPDAG
jgi:two-component system OmpR family response regulator